MDLFTVKGFVAASFTPFDDQGNVNLSAIDKYQQYLCENGIGAVYVNGSTGEGTSLTLQERKEIAEKWMELSRLPGREMKVLVQVGGGSFKEVSELAKHAALLSVDAISTLPPLYFLPDNVDELVSYCQAIGELAPLTPLYYYHIPERTKVAFDMEEFLQKCRQRVPSLRGIKFTCRDLYEGSRCLRTVDADNALYDMLYGQDEQVLSALAIGFEGAIGSTYGFMPKLCGCLKKEYDEKRLDIARGWQHKSVDVVKLLKKFGSRLGGLIPAMKVVMTAVGVDVGPPRFPMKPLEFQEKQELLESLKNLGFFDWQYTCFPPRS